MVLVFGFGPGRPRDMGEVAPAECPACRNDVMMHHVVSKKSFSLFFVPVVPYGRDDWLLCPVCSQGVPITPEQRSGIEAMKALTARLRLGEISREHYEAEIGEQWRRLGLDRVPPHRQVPGEPEPGPDDRDLVQRIEALVSMHENGDLTDEQFESAKAKLLGSDGGGRPWAPS